MSLSAAIASLRGELTRAWRDGRGGQLRFKPAPVELTLEVGVTGGAKGSAGISWWLVGLGAELSRESAATQTIKLTLDPVLFDDDGNPVEFLIEGDERVGTTGPADPPMDSAD